MFSFHPLHSLLNLILLDGRAKRLADHSDGEGHHHNSGQHGQGANEPASSRDGISEERGEWGGWVSVGWRGQNKRGWDTKGRKEIEGGDGVGISEGMMMEEGRTSQ